MISQQKIRRKSPWVIGLALASLAALLLLVNLAVTTSRKSQPASTIQAPSSTSSVTTPKEDLYGLPRRLQIPKIGINAEVKYVGMMSDGNMEPPKGPAEVGWYKRGPRPGDKGSAVVAGHFGWLNRPAAFDNLHKLAKGDSLYVLDDQGKSVVFVVSKSRLYSPGDNTADIFAQNDGGSHLNLITCEGAWDKAHQAYAKRLVVFADKAN